MAASSNGSSRLSFSLTLAGSLVGVGILLQLLLLQALGKRVLEGSNDFVAFYCSGHLLSAGKLYDVPAMMAEQRRALGFSSDVWLYVRLPYLALFYWPFSQLPYLTAWAAAGATSIGALAGVCRFWPGADARILAALSLFFLPLGAGLWNGQDVVYLLLWLAIGLLLHQRGKAFAAGMVWALLAAKPHLFLLLPVVLVVRRQWRAIAGGATGGAILLALSFLVAGPGWLPQFLATIRNPVIQERVQMANLYLLTAGLAPDVVVMALAAPLLAYCVGRIAKTDGLELGLGASALAGILLAQHTYMADCTLLLPLLYRIADRSIDAPLRHLATLLLLPFGYFLLLQPAPWSWCLPVLLLTLLLRMAFLPGSILGNYREATV